MIWCLWYSKGNGEDSTGNGQQTLVEVFGLPHRTVTVTDMVKKAKWRAREAIGNREGKLMAEAISEDRIVVNSRCHTQSGQEIDQLGYVI